MNGKKSIDIVFLFSSSRFEKGSSPTCAKILDEHGLKTSGNKGENGNYSPQIYRKASSKRIPSHYNTIKGNVSEELLEHCRANVINYYVCYGSAVVSVRNAERLSNRY